MVKVLSIGANIIIPFIVLFLAFATFMGYIAEEIRGYYNYKWVAIALIVVGYLFQFYKKTMGLILVGISIFIWFLF
jgi:hypothetical protein